MRRSRLLPSVVLALSLAGCAAPETGAETGGERPVSRGVEPAALLVLRQWDEARARAWARADVGALRSLYLPDTAAGVRDASMLLRWRDRGLRVEGMQTQVLAARVVAQGDDRLVLVVTDRLARAVASGRGGRAVLPADRATTRRITFRLADGRWRVASVLPASAPVSAQP
jgi:hypothetical protein